MEDARGLKGSKSVSVSVKEKVDVRKESDGGDNSYIAPFEV